MAKKAELYSRNREFLRHLRVREIAPKSLYKNFWGQLIFKSGTLFVRMLIAVPRRPRL